MKRRSGLEIVLVAIAIPLVAAMLYLVVVWGIPQLTHHCGEEPETASDGVLPQASSITEITYMTLENDRYFLSAEMEGFQKVVSLFHSAELEPCEYPDIVFAHAFNIKTSDEDDAVVMLSCDEEYAYLGFDMDCYRYDLKCNLIEDVVRLFRENGRVTMGGTSIPELGIQMSLRDVSPTGATVVFSVTEPSAAQALIYGDDFFLDRYENGTWERVPDLLDGNYGFSAMGWNIDPQNGAEWEIDWNWLYGSLQPGSYRIEKSVLDQHHDTNSIYAYFDIG